MAEPWGDALIVLKLAAVELVSAVGLVAASQIQLLNTALNVFGVIAFLLMLWLAPRAFKAKGMEAELAEKDRTIKSRTEAMEVAEDLTEQAKEKSAELGTMLDEARHEASAWQARYDEQARYTAGPALQAITGLLERSEQEAARRHKEMLLALRALRSNRFWDDEDSQSAGPVGS